MDSMADANIIKMLKPKQWLYGITLLFGLIFLITIPTSASAPFIFLKNIEIGAIDFVNLFGLIRDLSLAVLFSSLYISMMAILSSIVNIKFNELSVIIIITSILAFLLWGVPGLFVLSLFYYCREIKEFTEKMREVDPSIASAIPMTMTFIIIGLLGGLWAARGQLYFEPESLEFTRGFGRVWLGCPLNMTVDSCAEHNAEISIGYSLLLENCNALQGEKKTNCIQEVEETKEDAYQARISRLEELGETHHSVGEFTTIALAQYLNTWVGLLPNESKFILAMIVFSLITLIGFALEICVPFITSLLMEIFVGYKIIHEYEREEKTKHLVVLE